MGPRYRYAGGAVAAVWAAVVAASIFSPDMITGSQHEHLAIAGILDWVWGAIATALILMTAAVGRRGGDQIWRGFAYTVAAIWLGVTLASIYAPDMVTGSDPTRIPLSAIISPIAGTLATAFLCIFAAAAPGAGGPGPGANGHARTTRF